MYGMHMNEQKPTRLERKLTKELDKEQKLEEHALYHHLKMMEKAEHHRKVAEELRERLAKLQIKEARLEEKIYEHEVKAHKLSEDKLP